MLAFFIFIFILSLLIMVHEYGHFFAAKRTGVRVENFSLGFGPQLFRKKKNGTEYSISAIPLGGFVKLAGDNLEEYTGKPDEYFSQPVAKRFGIVFFGPLLNYVLGFLCLWFIFFAGYPTPTTKVGDTLEGFGAKEAGIKSGDKIISVDGEKVELWDQLQNIIQAKKPNTKAVISFLRDNQEIRVGVLIKEKEIDDSLGQKHSIGLLGIVPDDEFIKIKHGFFASFTLGIKKTWDLTALTYKGLWRMMLGKLSIRESVTGPLGIFFITSKVATLGLTAVLHLVAVLSISLCIFNLLPFPILDGGHIFFMLLEKIRGKTLSLKAENIVNRIGLSAIITLAAFVTYNDILRLFGEKITKFFSK